MTKSTVEAVIAAPRPRVYAVFADRESGGDFLPLSTRLVSPGTDERQGVGAVHFLGLGKVGVREQITELVPDERIAYKVVGGIPVRSHTGLIEFSDDPAGTKVRYTMDSDPKLPVPAPILTKVLDTLMGQMIGGVKRAVANG
ncbi:MAG TPA: SRPBCC family protein [Gordonia sp. (in: high G+C Gram-positive bacteria)]|uniref:SRPBCC family protein n=1 Tax=unclassified Gordonia (in: high G+C Gram-positive bacteria) TaxID=2657482 RepID=UPI000F991647|nr:MULTISPECIES: SRPBCC family protein [unclassified Gordonia (in: high G+C Gram-positive bacteria)]RUP40728.1 MAG: SRPBCC family protein [Gordonia sp. (in: high G+C Gram-positive bacteria)]HNP58940.1 SRPBCC family protein [Gordonia sp. (in: high G+C Gram-positive bacteria)]HRC52747.1 SRPBCC family protein [Gordonia sp. (in: high G+C Gram-positive bacteria)]